MYAEERRHGLAEVCVGPTQRGVWNLKGFARGVHPTDTDVTITDVFDLETRGRHNFAALTRAALAEQGWAPQAGRLVAPPETVLAQGPYQ